MKSIIAKPPKRLHPSGKKGADESPDKVLALNLRKAVEKKDLLKRTTVNLYSLKVGDSLFGLPYCALNDAMALRAQKEILPQSNVYRVGSFCLYDGSVIRSRPVLILDTKVS